MSFIDFLKYIRIYNKETGELLTYSPPKGGGFLDTNVDTQ